MATSDVLLVGIDIGTTNLKATAVRPSGRVEAVARRPMVIERPAAGAAEFDLDALDRDIVAVLTELTEALAAKGAAPHSVAGIGVASIGESFVGLDGGDSRVTPCPTWYDRRTRNRREEWGLSPCDWFDITGVVDDDIYTGYRLAWWRDADPGRFAAVKSWLMVADYATFLLSGRKVSSPSLAARSGLADRRNGHWSYDLLDRLGLPESELGELLPSATVAAGLRDDVARATGLLAGTPIVNAGHDHPCAGLGCGLVDPGRMIDSTGTSEALKTVVAMPLTYDEAGRGAYDCYPHVVQDRFLLSGHIPSSGGLIDWLVDLLGGHHPRPETVGDLWRRTAAEPPGARGVRIAPFLEGTGAPWNQRSRRADFAFLSHTANAGTLLRAAVEGLAAWLHLNLERFEAITGLQPSELTLTGGGARNELANTIKAAMLRRPLVIPTVEEAAGVGAALVAGLATGVFDHPSSLASLPDVSWRRIEVDEALAAAYRDIVPSLRAHLLPAGGGLD
ncbi:FGGY-family carbohydrate kinase [Mesorhizobium sp. ASY16-5R]|uniref:FGGY-family carbohydrate kinase n=1 Tax=Mesorhizobium sp. ASY16-5R TaxID=3445772 RepID=UPI003F9F1210